MPKNNGEPKDNNEPASIEDAKMAIVVARQMLTAMGNNDIEFDLLNRLEKRLDSKEADKISPDDAIKEANGIVANKYEP